VIHDTKNIHNFKFHQQALANFPIQTIVTFSYNGEPVALFHVKYLYDIVNLFIIAESRYTISGKLKPELFFQSPDTVFRFAPYRDKIRYVILDDVPPRPSNYTLKWANPISYNSFWAESYQRVYVQQFIPPNSKGIVICVDSDEIIHKELLSSFKDELLYDSGAFRQPKSIPMLLFYYNFLWHNPVIWGRAFVVDIPGYLSLNDLLLARMDSFDYVSIDLIGWHLSYFLSREDIKRKISSFAHREYDMYDDIMCYCTNFKNLVLIKLIFLSPFSPLM
jgi:hypothetical protein